FIVAEAFTNKPGKVTPLADTVRSFKEICDGKWDRLPESAFMYVGAIEEAAEQAKKMAVEHMPDPLKCTVVTPELAVLDEADSFVAVPMYDGELGVLPGRAPLIGRLGYGELGIVQGKATRRFFVDGGFVQVRNNVVSVLTAHAIPEADLKVPVAEQALE